MFPFRVVIFPHWTIWIKKEHEQMTFYPVDGNSIKSSKILLILIIKIKMTGATPIWIFLTS
jgi:hypothetical protein